MAEALVRGQAASIDDAGNRAPALPRALIALAGACGAAGTAWSAAAGKVPGAVAGGIAVVLAVCGWWLSGRPPRVPVTDAGHHILVATYTHYRRGGMQSPAVRAAGCPPGRPTPTGSSADAVR